MGGISGGFHPLPPGDKGRSPLHLRNPPLGVCAAYFGAACVPTGPFPVARQPRSILPSILPVMVEMLPSMSNCLLGRESHKCHGVNTCGSNNDSTLDMTAAIPEQRLLLFQWRLGEACMTCYQINNVRLMQQQGWCSGLRGTPANTPGTAALCHSRSLRHTLQQSKHLSQTGQGRAGVSAGEPRIIRRDIYDNVSGPPAVPDPTEISHQINGPSVLLQPAACSVSSGKSPPLLFCLCTFHLCLHKLHSHINAPPPIVSRYKVTPAFTVQS